jgi:hypothetical protein
MKIVRGIVCVTILFLMAACATQGTSPGPAAVSDSKANSGISAQKLKELGIKETQGAY